MKNKISVIVPIYNVEKYLDKCINSIINQTYDNLEIILVNDGSSDNSLEICKKYQKKDNRIILITKENGGLSDARNVGMEKATGKWYVFIDSDDYIELDYIEFLYKLVIKHDSDIGIVLPFYFREFDTIQTIDKKISIKYLSNYSAVETMLYQKEFDTSAWGKIYKSELFNNIKFPVGKLYEDISTIYKVFLRANEVVYSNAEKYFYLQRSNSIMGRPFRKKDMDYIYQTEEMLRNIKKLDNKKLTKAAQCRFVNANFSVLLKIKKNSNYSSERLIALKNIKKYRKSVLFNKKSRLKTKGALLLSLVNYF